MTSRRAASWTGIGTIVALFLEAYTHSLPRLTHRSV